MHVIVKFLNADGYEVVPERYLFCPSLNVDSILVSAYSDSEYADESDMLLDSCKMEII